MTRPTQPGKFLLCSLAAVLSCILLSGIGLASRNNKQGGAGFASAQSAATATTSSKPTSAEIAAAKAKGMVWVNTKTRVYHTHGRYYGKTKHGEFMPLAEAKKEGYKSSKR